MRVQLSMFPMDLDPLVAGKSPLVVGTALEPASAETVLEPQAEEATRLAEEIGDYIVDETVSLLSHPANLVEEEQQPDTVPPAVLPVISPKKQFDLILREHWTNSMDLAYCMINIALPEDEGSLFDDFTTYITACP